MPSLNKRIAGLDDELFAKPPESENILIVGAPRSGTTLISQVMACVFDVGYINNVAAAFWEAPATGVLHAKRFVSQRKFMGASNYGMTSHPSEPHEFGGFWRSRLAYSGMTQKVDHQVNWEQLLHSLDQIGAAWQKPVFYKVFQLAWHLAEFDSLRSNAKWIWVQRDLAANVKSLLKLAADRGDRWTSAVPLAAIENYDQAEDWQRVTAQVVLFTNWLQQQFEQVSPSRLHQLRLEDLIADPSTTINSLGEFLGVNVNQQQLAGIADALNSKGNSDSEFEARVNEFARGVQV